MGYKGQTYAIPCDRGGLNHSRNIDFIPPESMVHPSRNINLHEAGRTKRGGTAYTDNSDWDAAITGTPEILSLFYYRKRDGTENIIAACANGIVYDAHDNSIIDADWTTTEPTSFAVFDDELYIASRGKVPYKFTDAGDAAVLTNIPSDWSGDGPGWVVKHGRGASERTWWGFTDTNPQRIYISALSDGDLISDTDAYVIDIETEDGFGIVGAREFGDRLLCFGKKKVYVIDDTDIASSNWGYQAAQWDGGAASNRLIVRIPNDIICMEEDGIIYSVTAAENYGDYKAASLVSKNYIHRWIKEYINLTQIAKFHAIFDPKLRAIKWFMCKAGNTSCDVCLVQFIDRPPEEAFTYHDGGSTSGYNASSSCLYRKAVGNWVVLTGDVTNGRVWELETADTNDEGSGYYGGFKTPWLTFGNPRVSKQYKRARLVTEAEGDWDLTINWWVDGTAETSTSVNLAGQVGSLLGDTTTPLGTFVLGGEELIDEPFNLDQYGKRIRFEIYNSTADEDFFISQLMVDFKEVGAKSDA